MDDEKASSAPRGEGEVTRRRARSAPPALFVEPKSVAPEADTLPIDVPEVTATAPAPRRRPMPPAKSRSVAPAPSALPTPTDEPTDPPADPARPPRARKSAPPPAADPPTKTPSKRVTKPRTAEAAPAQAAPIKATPTKTAPTEAIPTKASLTEPAAPAPTATAPTTTKPATPAPTADEPSTSPPHTEPTATTAAAGKPAAHEPAPPSEPAGPAPETADRRPPDRGDWRARTPKPISSRPSQAELWAAVRTRPGLVPAALAIVAVDRFGPVAQQRARWLVGTYPRVPAERLARVAVREATTRTRYATAVSLVPLGGVLGLSTQLWAHARMVLEIAAAFGQDPCADERAADLLTLLRIYPDTRSARSAVTTVTIIATSPATLPPISEPADRPIDEAAGASTDRPVDEPAGASADKPPARRPTTKPAGLRAVLTRPPVVGVAGIQLARRAARRWFPGSGIVLDGLSTASATEALANRTVRFYRDASHR